MTPPLYPTLPEFWGTFSRTEKLACETKGKAAIFQVMATKSVFLNVMSMIGLLTAGRAAESPLFKAASDETKALPAGCVVVAESQGKGGKPVYAVFGKAEPEGTVPEDLVFEIGSISKVFTGLLLALAVEEGRATLETTVGELLKGKVDFKDPAVAAITLRQLATHTSGLPRLPGNLVNADSLEDPYAAYDREALHAFLKNAKLEGEPPYDSSYSNLGLGLLGDLLAGVYGGSWESLVVEKITKPLGMGDTTVTLSAGQQRRFAPPYEGGDKEVPWTFQALAGAGALRSTAADMVLFGQALAFPESSPLKTALLKVREPQSATGAAGIGLALMLGKVDGKPVLEHGGGTGGYRSLLQVFPESGLVRVILSNNAGFTPEAVAAAGRGTAEKAPGAGKGRDAVKLSPEQLSEYPGVYVIDGLGAFTVLLTEGRLRVRLTGQAFAPVFAKGEDRFVYDVVAAELAFQRENGKVASVVLRQNGREVPAKRADKPLPAVVFRTNEELKAYEGKYAMASASVLAIETRDDTLWVRLAGQPYFPVFETKPDRFEYDVVEAALEFQRDEAGAVKGVRLHQNGLVLPGLKGKAEEGPPAKEKAGRE